MAAEGARNGAEAEKRLEQLAAVRDAEPVDAYTTVIGSGVLSLEAAAAELKGAGWPVQLLSAEVTGDAAEAARAHARLLRQYRSQQRRCALLSGGETTVRVDSAAPGRGGRNTHFALAVALELWGDEGISCLSADTDGIDGSAGAAGGFVTPALWQRAGRSAAAAALAAADSGTFLKEHGHALVTGPTGTNVNDLRIMLVEG